ncbi:hypothetical protein J0H58_14645 [bacterium]|nr:hypothetical protein [bacterium]
MATRRCGDDSQSGRLAGFPRGRAGRVRPAAVLPLVRAALARGDGPPAVVAWVRQQGAVPHPGDWTAADEARARALADRLADHLTARLRAEARTLRAGSTLGPPGGDDPYGL